MTTQPSLSSLYRQQRRLRNDDVILDVAVRLAAEQGWAGLSPGHVAEAAGLSRPTVLQRHASRVELGVALWAERLWLPLRDGLEPLVSAVEAADGAAILAALAPFLAPALPTRASVELLIVSTYVPVVDSVVGSTFGAWLGARLTGLPDDVAARLSYVVGSALGLVLQAHALATRTGQSRQELRFLVAGLVAQRHPQMQPQKPVQFDGPQFDTGDSTRDAVLRATIDSVSEVGYEAATIEVIAARCGFTRTVIFRRYPTKYDLFLDASRRTLGPLILAMDQQRREVEEQWGTGLSDAWFGRQLIRPEMRALRTIILEEVRLATHLTGIRAVLGAALSQPNRPMAHVLADDDLDDDLGKRAVELAIASGMLLLAQLRPQIWSLPYDVVSWRGGRLSAAPISDQAMPTGCPHDISPRRSRVQTCDTGDREVALPRALQAGHG